ncbi:hypothetical protein Hanom_Chr00s000005g01611301 [Helianthus anomalus]
MYQQIKFTLDPETNTARYKLIYQPMEQNFLEEMALWCYDSDTHEAMIVFKVIVRIFGCWFRCRS